MDREGKVECTKCKHKTGATEIVIWDNKIECYKCWEFLINKKKVKELREQLSQYIKINKNEPKKSLTLSQLKEVKQIFEDNYFGETDNRSKEIFSALVWRGKNTSPGNFPLYRCLEKIEQEIKRLERALEPQPENQPEKVSLNCPFCNKEFSCEVEKYDPTEIREAREELNERKVKHIREVHGEEESESDNDKSNQKIEQTNSDSSQPRTNSLPKLNENKNRLDLLIIVGIVGGILLIGSIFFLARHNRIRTKKTK